MGGPIVKDKVWGFFAYLNQRNSVAAPPAGVILDGTPFDTKLFNYTGKGTYQLNQNNKFIGYLQYGTKQQPQPHRQQQPPRRAGSHHGRFDGAAGLAELGLQGRVERHDRRRTCSRSSAPGSSATTSGWTATPSDIRYEDLSPTRSAAAAVTG